MWGRRGGWGGGVPSVGWGGGAGPGEEVGEGRREEEVWGSGKGKAVFTARTLGHLCGRPAGPAQVSLMLQEYSSAGEELGAALTRNPAHLAKLRPLVLPRRPIRRRLVLVLAVVDGRGLLWSELSSSHLLHLPLENRLQGLLEARAGVEVRQQARALEPTAQERELPVGVPHPAGRPGAAKVQGGEILSQAQSLGSVLGLGTIRRAPSTVPPSACGGQCWGGAEDWLAV